MACAPEYDLNICRGVTSTFTFRSGGPPYKYKAISNITNAAPCVITAPSHEVPDQWPIAIVGVTGMDELEAKKSPPSGKDWKIATVTDANTIELNQINSVDYVAYTSGGKLQYYTPTDLSSVTDVKFSVYTEEGGTLLLEYTTTDNVSVDSVNYYIIITIPSTEVITFDEGYFIITLHYAGDVIRPVLEGTLSVEG